MTLQPRQGFGLSGKGHRCPLPSIAEIFADWIYKRTNQDSAGAPLRWNAVDFARAVALGVSTVRRIFYSAIY